MTVVGQFPVNSIFENIKDIFSSTLLQSGFEGFPQQHQEVS